MTELPKDALRHTELAEGVLVAANLRPSLRVISVEGSWGRGKTDTLERLAHLAREGDTVDGVTREVLWVNPWQHAEPNLLSPLILDLLDLIAASTPEKLGGIKDIATGVALGAAKVCWRAFRKTTVGSIADTTLDEMQKAIEDRAGGARPEVDTGRALGQRFAKLVELALGAIGAKPNQRLLICVDDLDRCLPHQQVAMMEALHFLTRTKARVVFVVAMDPAMAGEGLRTHYSTQAIDTERYLDKMFDLRIALPGVDLPDVKALAEGHIESLERGARQAMCDEFRTSGDLVNAITHATAIAELRNPRLVRKVFDRLYLFCCSPDAEQVVKQSFPNVLTAWLFLIERWPILRSVMSDAGSEAGQAWASIVTRARGQANNYRPSLLARLPPADKMKGLVELVDNLGKIENEPADGAGFGGKVRIVEEALRARGL
jgi:hypothetical protein